MDTAVTDQYEQQRQTDAEITAALTQPGATGNMITALARVFDVEPTDVGLALSAAKRDTLARRAAQAPPPPVAPYYRLVWSEREVSGHQIILTAAELATTADPEIDDVFNGVGTATSDPKLMARIARHPHEFAFDDRVTDLDGHDHSNREITDVERFDFEVEPLTVAEAFDEGHRLYQLKCWNCDARVERRGLRYVHAEQGTFNNRAPMPVSQERLDAMLAQHAPGVVCPDSDVTEDHDAPVNVMELDAFAAQWEKPPPADQQ